MMMDQLFNIRKRKIILADNTSIEYLKNTLRVSHKCMLSIPQI